MSEFDTMMKALKTAMEKNTAKDVEVVQEGKQIIIPEGMSFREAKLWMERKEKEDETVFAVRELIHGYPFDAAYAFNKAMANLYGWNNSVPSPGFFGTKNPPMMIGIETGLGETVQIPWGRFQLPNVEGFLHTYIDCVDGLLCLHLSGEVKQKNKAEVAALVAETRRVLTAESIYKGKAIRINFPHQDPEDFDINDAPRFLDLSKVNRDELIFPQDTYSLVDSSLFTPVLHTDACRKARVPLKRGVLLEGPFGVGKTLTAYTVAQMCVENGWTFIYLDDLSDLPTAVRFAKNYEPALIFAEDIDRVIDERRNDAANEILNTIDGIDSKNRELIVVLTTNNVEKIHPAMLRPGRLDAVIPVRPPDAYAVERLIRLYGGSLVPRDESLLQVGRTLAGQIPAVIREVVERSKLAAISRTKGSGDYSLTGHDLELAARGMLSHLELIKPKVVDTRSDREKAAELLGTTLVKGLTASVETEVTYATPGMTETLETHTQSNGKRGTKTLVE